MTVTPLYLTWLNYLGGFEYFFFTTKKEFQIDIQSSGTSQKNILPSWPQSYSKNADTIIKQTFRESGKKIVVVTQHLTLNQLDALKYIKTSPLVQIVTSRVDRTTVIVDTDSFKLYDERDKLFTLQFTITYTDNIPSQRL